MKLAAIFPGQGAQSVGMLADIARLMLQLKQSLMSHLKCWVSTYGPWFKTAPLRFWGLQKIPNPPYS